MRLLAVRTIWLLLATVAASDSAYAQEQTLPAWLNISPNEAAIILSVAGKVEGKTFVLISNDEVLDETRWNLSLPFVKQYRLKPGDYVLQEHKSGKEVNIRAESGHFSLVKLDLVEEVPKFSLAEQAFSPLNLSKSGKLNEIGLNEWSVVFKYGDWPGNVWPINYITPKGKTLVLYTRSPWEVPPPKRKPENDGDAK